MTFRHRIPALLLVTCVLIAGCGSKATATQRVDRCLKKQPDATEADCKKWESDSQLNDDGAHQGHESM